LYLLTANDGLIKSSCTHLFKWHNSHFVWYWHLVV
jgi:hypothetical protein